MNWWIFFLAVLFFIEQNRYFGWNAFPQSDAELMADGIMLVIAALSFKESK